MLIYIASSYKNMHGVSQLEATLGAQGHTILSWLKNNEQHKTGSPHFEKWVETDAANACFVFDTKAAMTADLVIYYGPSGPDAWAEIGAAFGAQGPIIIGLRAPGEQIGLMRHMVSSWVHSIPELLYYINQLAQR